MGDAKSWNGVGTLTHQRKLMAEQMGNDSPTEPKYEQFRGSRRYEVSERVKKGARVERRGDRFTEERKSRRNSLK